MNSLSLFEFGAANDLISSPVLSFPVSLFKFWYLNLSHSIEHAIVKLFCFHIEFTFDVSCIKLLLFSSQRLIMNEVFD